jgi:flavin reductase (DIM6/NTAB) family NADH-FMN oxidoreductase RutF
MRDDRGRQPLAPTMSGDDVSIMTPRPDADTPAHTTDPPDARNPARPTAHRDTGTFGGTAAEDPTPSEQLRRAFRGHPAGVVVITVAGAPGAGRPAGFTATSLVSLSLDPPLVSFAIASTASSWPHVRDCATAVVHFLGVEHQELAARFATSGIDRFAEPTRFSRLPGGEPLLDGVESWLLLEVQQLIPVGDHQLVIGRVTRARTGDDHRPLLYHDGAYHSV